MVRGEKDRVYIHSVSGPDWDGRIAFIEGQWDLKPDHERFSLRTIRQDGREEQEVFSRPGDPMWSYKADSVGKSLALAPVGGHVAFVRKPKSVQFENQPFYLQAGSVEVWDVTKKTGGEVGVTAIERGSDAFVGNLCWFPDVSVRPTAWPWVLIEGRFVANVLPSRPPCRNLIHPGLNSP